MAVSKRTRFEVLRRDNYTCRYMAGVVRAWIREINEATLQELQNGEC